MLRLRPLNKTDQVYFICIDFLPNRGLPYN